MTDPAFPHALTRERTLPASPERVFRAWTEPDELARWFSPNPELVTEAEVDLRVGGAYRIRMGTYEVVGRYARIDAPRSLAFTWRWSHEPDAPDTLVTVELVPLDGGGTRLTLRHERFASEAERANHDDGWQRTLDRLPAALQSAPTGGDGGRS